MVLAVLEHILIPLVAFIPSILHDLNSSFLAKRLEDLDVVRIAYADESYLPFILERY